ncbi:MAG TPA: nucleotidyltransferase family protein [Chloroflexota bacterium]|nr:nucleotidyltransferase family protein [Chloroflexota bacterium]
MSPDPNLVALSALVTRALTPFQVSADRWPAISALAVEHGLGPILYWTLGSEAKSLLTDDSSIPAQLRDTLRQATVHSLVLGQASRRIQTALNLAGIPALWLKGLPLAHTVYPDPDLRPMVDLDLLVPYERRLAALECLESLGFRRSEEFTYEAVPRVVHRFAYNYSLRGGNDGVIAVELHFHLLDRIREQPLLPVEQVGWFWEHPLRVDDGDFAFRTLRPEAHVLYLCAHAILQHGEADLRLLRYLDLYLLLTRYATSGFDWRQVVEQATTLGWTYAVERALALTARYFGTPVPEWVWRELRDRRRPTENVYCVVERQNQTNHWDDLKDASAALSRHERWLVLRALVFPSRSHLRHRYALDGSQPVWPRYPRLWFEQAREVATWAWQRLTPREPSGKGEC